MKRLIIGSTYFFGSFPDFKPHDIDYLILSDEVETTKHIILFDKACYIYWNENLTKDDHITFARSCDPIILGKFLVKEFTDLIGFTIADLSSLKDRFLKIDSKHSYQILIFNYYLENNGFFLTNKQREDAYAEYKLRRR